MIKINHWSEKDVPHKGWRCIEMIDLGEGLEDISPDERAEYYEICEMCGQEGIRYVHVMKHNNYSDTLRVGRQCASNMEADYRDASKRERDMQNRYKRWLNFNKQVWIRNEKGNYVKRYKGQILTIVPSEFYINSYGVAFRSSPTYKYDGKKITSFEQAEKVAFNLIDRYLQNK